MPDLLDRLGVALLDASLAATAIAGFVVLAMVQCRQPARRRGWARAGLLSTLALLPLAALNPVPRIDLRVQLRAILEDAPRAIRADRPKPATATPAASPGPASSPGWGRQVGRGLVVAYLAGLGLGLAALGLGLWGSGRLIRSARPASAASNRAYASLTEGRRRRPRLLVSTRAGRPVLLGALRPAILIPPELEAPEQSDRLRLGLLHELAHEGSGDHRHGLAAHLAQALWFFLPPVWWIREQMKLDQEFLADREAVSRYGTSGDYASALVTLASGRSEGGAPAPEAAPGAASGVASALYLRVLMLLRCPFAIEGTTPGWWRWWASTTLGLATLAASCLSLRGFASLPTTDPEPAAQGRSFRLPDLAIGQQADSEQPFDLRFRLPDLFNLTLEVMAEPEDLPSLEVLGHALGPLCDIEPGVGPSRDWHRVRICRTAEGESVEVDGRPIAATAIPRKPAPWLTVRPPAGRTTRVRNLELFW